MLEEAPKIENESFTGADERELNYLERLQTGPVNGIEWNPAFSARLLELRKRKEAGPTQGERDRYNYLTRLRNENNNEWPEELRAEFSGLQDLMDRKNK